MNSSGQTLTIRGLVGYQGVCSGLAFSHCSPCSARMGSFPDSTMRFGNELVSIHAIPLVEGMAVDRAPAPKPAGRVDPFPRGQPLPNVRTSCINGRPPHRALDADCRPPRWTAWTLEGALRGPRSPAAAARHTGDARGRYLRRRDANQAAHDIRCALATSRGLPVPHRDGAPMQSVKTTSSESCDYSRLLETHPTVLRKPRRLPARPGEGHQDRPRPGLRCCCRSSGQPCATRPGIRSVAYRTGRDSRRRASRRLALARAPRTRSW